MTVTVNIIFNIKSGRSDDFKEVLRKALPETRAFSGCRSVQLLEDQDRSGQFTLLEEWDSKDDQLRYMAWRAETGSPTAHLFDGERVISYLDTIDI